MSYQYSTEIVTASVVISVYRGCCLSGGQAIGYRIRGSYLNDIVVCPSSLCDASHVEVIRRGEGCSRVARGGNRDECLKVTTSYNGNMNMS